MRKLILVLLALSLSGCASRTEFGECVGINDEPLPNLQYRYSTRNIVLGTIFIETLFVPLIVVFNEIKCPVGAKAAEKK